MGALSSELVTTVGNWRDLVILLDGDVRENLLVMPDESVHCSITSPPYWGLRRYKTEPQVWGGGADCVHDWGSALPGSNRGGSGTPTDKNNRGEGYGRDVARGSYCQHCGAWRGNLGLEPSAEMYIGHLVEVFREVRRVLRQEGTLWLVVGDCYASQGGSEPYQTKWQVGGASATQSAGMSRMPGGGLKPKDLVGIPWLLALALRADGWWLRCPVWRKPNCIPGSQKDRPTIDYEYVLLLSKSERYYYDGEAVREPNVRPYDRPCLHKGDSGPVGDQNSAMAGRYKYGRVQNTNGRTRRAVWSIPTQPTPVPGVHFASYPTALVDLCIRAGTSERGCCPACGAPWTRLTRNKPMVIRRSHNHPPELRTRTSGTMLEPAETETLGWAPSCKCGLETQPCTVLDPFVGTGTTCVAATRLGRASIGIDLSPEYLAAAEKRLEMGK